MSYVRQYPSTVAVKRQPDYYIVIVTVSGPDAAPPASGDTLVTHDIKKADPDPDPDRR